MTRRGLFEERHTVVVVNPASDERRALEYRFEADLRNACEVGKRECKINPVRFLQMLGQYGGVGAAKRLLDPSTQAQSGFTDAWLCKTVFPTALDYTVEAIAWKCDFRDLFTDAELATARERLQDLQHRPPWANW
jgi:hypothetical protein